MKRILSGGGAAVLAALLMLGSREAVAQLGREAFQRGTVTGTVKEQADGTPVAGALLQLG